MIVLRGIEGRERQNLRHDRALVSTGLIERGEEFLRCGLLRRIMKEDHRPVLVADIRSLPVLRRRIVICEEDLQEFFIGNFFPI